MKQYLLIGSVVALLLAGCSQKDPEIAGDLGAGDKDKSYKELESTSSTSTVDGTAIDGGVKEVDLVNENLGDSSNFAGVSSIYFDFDKFNIRGDMQKAMEDDATAFKSSENASLNIKVEGNCDEWGSDEYNYALGLKRAKTVKDFLVSNGINEGRMTLVSYGESNPVCKERTKDCDAQNRRVDFKILP